MDCRIHPGKEKKKHGGKNIQGGSSHQNETKTPAVLNSRDGRKQIVSRHKPSEAAILWIDLSMDLCLCLFLKNGEKDLTK